MPILVEAMERHGHLQLEPEVHTIVLVQRRLPAMRLLVNFFQPSFKLAAKARDGAQVRKRYHPPGYTVPKAIGAPTDHEEVRRRHELRARSDPADQRAQSEAQATAASARSVCGSHDHATGEAEPWHTSREFLERLQAEHPGVYPDGRLRTLQRRLNEWRREAAHRIVFGTTTADSPGDLERGLLTKGSSSDREGGAVRQAKLAGSSR
jgi:hypothetical protein